MVVLVDAGWVELAVDSGSSARELREINKKLREIERKIDAVHADVIKIKLSPYAAGLKELKEASHAADLNNRDATIEDVNDHVRDARRNFANAESLIDDDRKYEVLYYQGLCYLLLGRQADALRLFTDAYNAAKKLEYPYIEELKYRYYRQSVAGISTIGSLPTAFFFPPTLIATGVAAAETWRQSGKHGHAMDNLKSLYEDMRGIGKLIIALNGEVPDGRDPEERYFSGYEIPTKYT